MPDLTDTAWLGDVKDHPLSRLALLFHCLTLSSALLHWQQLLYRPSKYARSQGSVLNRCNTSWIPQEEMHCSYLSVRCNRKQIKIHQLRTCWSQPYHLVIFADLSAAWQRVCALGRKLLDVSEGIDLGMQISLFVFKHNDICPPANESDPRCIHVKHELFGLRWIKLKQVRMQKQGQRCTLSCIIVFT